MSAEFIITYHGAPLRFLTGRPTAFEVTTLAGATTFTSEADAWWHAYRTQLPEQHLKVINRSAEPLAAT